MRLDDRTERILSQYLSDVRSLPNESAKTHRFAALVAELFPGTTASTELAAGVEKLVRIDTEQGTKRGRIDSYHGNAIIEFERSLKATRDEAERQLKEYSAGVWKKEGAQRRQLICIASDGIVWQSYRPRISVFARSRITPDDIELEPLRTILVSTDTLADFWIWLTSLLFRPARTNPTAEQFKMDFGATSLAFADAMDALEKAWTTVQVASEPKLAFDTWRRYLTVTYGQLGKDEKSDSSELVILFLKHTYLASIARLLIWASISKGKFSGGLREVASHILSGEFFRAQNIANLVDDDFFQWVRIPKAENTLAPVWERTLVQILTYDLSRLSQDVLKGVYQELVDPKDRHDLGEYYTPEWLCERVIAEMLPHNGFVSVLDPTCGSGSFLRAAIAHLLTVNPDGGDAKRLRSILDNVVGIEIHPLALTIAKATYVLAIRSLIKTTKRPIHIPVYLADALFLPKEVAQLRLGEIPSYEVRFGGNRVSMPEEFIKTPELFDSGIAAATTLAIDHAISGKESLASLRAYLRKAVPRIFDSENGEATVRALWEFTNELSRLIKKKQNSIWAFIVRNGYRPAMLKGRFDFIVGNPPWLSYRYIADPDYQAEVKKRAIDDYAIAPKSQKLFTQMELATIFLAHALKTFGYVDTQIGFVLPRSILSADQHETLRLATYKAPVRLTGYWDVLDVTPLFNVPSCVVFATRGNPVKVTPTFSLPASEWIGHLPARDISWSEASQYLRFEKGRAGLIYLGSRNALSTKPGRPFPNRPSRYAKLFHQGATILPRNFYFVRGVELGAEIAPDNLYWVETDPEQAEEAKPPYDDIVIRGHVEGRFLYTTALSRHLLPFVLLEPATIVLPIEQIDGRIELRTAANLKDEGYREFSSWMKKVEKIWTEKRKGKAAKQSVYERLDYNSELSIQDLGARYLVVYNAAGTNMSAAVVDRHRLNRPFVVEHKLYSGAFDDLKEASFVAAVLNANTVNEEIKPFQSHGLLGERDIEKKVLELPIPVFDPTRREHLLLVDLGERAEIEARKFLAENEIPKTLGGRRAAVRKAVAGILLEIDDLVGKLLRDGRS